MAPSWGAGPGGGVRVTAGAMGSCHSGWPPLQPWPPSSLYIRALPGHGPLYSLDPDPGVRPPPPGRGSWTWLVWGFWRLGWCLLTRGLLCCLLTPLQYVRLSQDTPSSVTYQLMTQHWGLDVPNLLISVTGGAKDFNMKPRLKSVFRRGLVKVAQTTGRRGSRPDHRWAQDSRPYLAGGEVSVQIHPTSPA